jgi:effector-binding domain-containing protein
MVSEPRIEQRGAQPYAAIRTRVTMAQVPTACPPLISQVSGWLDSRRIVAPGPAFFRYATFDGEHVVVDVGFPIRESVAGDDRVRTGTFPAGRYATLVHTGHYSGLAEATGRLLAWGRQQGLRWDASSDEREWAARIEWYPTDPMAEPDPQKWVTELAIQLKG